jgi:MFS family permease
MSGSRTAPLNAAGFVTAFGAHSVAAGLGVEHQGIGISLLSLGILLAVYDIAEVILKPVFGTLSDRIGVKPVIIGGLLAFGMVSLVGVFVVGPVALGIIRFGQGAAASAFSPASSAAVGRLAAPSAAGRYFGRYGSWKGLGYAAGPVLGGGLILLGGFPALFLATAAAALGTALWVTFSVPSVPVLPKTRYTVVDLARQLAARNFLLPVLALATATAALGSAVGFLPALGTERGMGTLPSLGVISVLAIVSSLVQPAIGRWIDAGRLRVRGGIPLGLVVILVGLLLPVIPSAAVLYLSAVLLGAGIGSVTALGFTHLATTTPPERLGRTMGTAELGRELGDAGGPLLVGAVAATATLSVGLVALASVAALVAGVTGALLRQVRIPGTAETPSDGPRSAGT